MTLKIPAHLSLSLQVATKQETLIVATNYSVILLQFLFQHMHADMLQRPLLAS